MDGGFFYMVKIGILKDFDIAERAGGAQRAMQLFELGAPSGVELVRIPATSEDLDPTCDAYITGLVKFFPDRLLEQLVQSGKPHIRYEFDLWDDAPNGLNWARVLCNHANVTFFPSPMYRNMFLGGWHIEPKDTFLCLAPPMRLEDFKAPREKYDEQGRNGVCYFGEIHPLKGVDIAIRWAANENVVLDIYGPMSWQFPPTQYAVYRGCPPLTQLYDEVASHEWLIHMPRRVDGFSYSILEAQLLGLRVYANGKLGIESWLEICTKGGFEELIEKCVLAPSEFWKLTELAVA
jgi:hypothetical protein